MPGPWRTASEVLPCIGNRILCSPSGNLGLTHSSSTASTHQTRTKGIVVSQVPSSVAARSGGIALQWRAVATPLAVQPRHPRPISS